MGFEDESLESFYPVCAICGEPIYEDGYQIEGEYYCEDCVSECRIDGTKVAEQERDGSYEAAMETKFEAGRDEY